MENRKLVILVPAIMLGIFVGAQSALAYAVETHAALTSNIFDFYNQSFPDKNIPEDLRNFLVDGSRHEDSAPRWMNHFYDPVNNRGLESTYGNGYSSKEWAVDKSKQNEARYKITTALASVLTAFQQKKLSALTTETDFTWERAIRFWVNGDKEKAMYLLGHVLHLIEDASVPDHTRNDAHPGFGEDQSPYENFAKDPEIYNKDSAAKLRGKSPVKLASLAEYFEKVARYSNNNFYSKGTIGLQSGYSEPEPHDYEKINDILFGIRKSEDGNWYKLSAQPTNSSVLVSIRREVSIEDRRVLADYWDLLSAKSIQYGAGVVDLFFKEVEKAKNDPHFVREEKTMLGKIIDAVSNTFGKIQTLARAVWDSANGGQGGQNVIEISLEPETAAVPAPANNAATTRLAAKKTSSTKPDPTLLPRVVEEDENAKELAGRLLAQENTTASTADETPKTEPAPKTTAKTATPKECSFAQGGAPSHRGAILNEIAWMGTATSANDEWIELKNVSGGILDISGWQLLDQGEQIKTMFPSGTKISSGGYFLLERTDDSSVPNIAADLIYAGALSNTNDGLRLFDDQCTLIDEALASPDWPAGNAADRLTMERDASGFGWHTTTIYGGTPKKDNSTPAPSVAPSGDGGSASASTSQTAPPPSESQASAAATAATHIVISEIQAGIDGDANAEFIELYNPTNQAVNLSGWELRKRTSAGVESNLVDNASFSGTIPAKGFFLVASKAYTGTVAPDLRYSATSATIAYTNNTVVLYSGDHASAPVVDEVVYASINAGASIERKAHSSSACVSAQGSGEFLGNGCDTDNTADFEIRTSPKPQNVHNLPEPRSAAKLKNPSASFSSTTMELVFSWDESSDAESATSTVAYEVKEYNSDSGVVIFHATSTREFRKRINEVGRDYHFSLQAFDRDGLGSATSSLDFTASPFLSDVAWYANPTATSTYLLEAWYDHYPFVPDVPASGPTQKVLAAYLNEDASKLPGNLSAANGMQLSASTTPLLFEYRNCGGSDGPHTLLFLPDVADWCSGTSGDVRLNSMRWDNLEDLHFITGISPRPEPFTEADYLTLAFYAFSGNGGSSQGYSLVAVDKTKYFFQSSPPTHQTGGAPSDLQISATHDESSGMSALTLSWVPSADPDSIDSLLRYEWSEDAASSTWQTLTLTTGPDTSKKYGSLTFPMGTIHTVALRSIDETGLASDTTSKSIALPPPPSCPEASGNTYYAIDCIKLQDGVVKVRWRLLRDPGIGAIFGIMPYLTGATPAVSSALHKDINGNSSNSSITANSGGPCSSSITPVEQYALGRQYQRNLASVSGVAASELTATSTLKFALFRGGGWGTSGPCSYDGTILFDDPVEYTVTTP